MTNMTVSNQLENEVRVSFSREVYAQIVERAKKTVNFPFEKLEDAIERIVNSEISIKISHLCGASKLQSNGVSDTEVDLLAKSYLIKDFLKSKEQCDVLALMNKFQYGLKTTKEEELLLIEAESYAEGVLAPISPLEALMRTNKMICNQKELGRIPTKAEFAQHKHLLELLTNKHHADASAARTQARATLERFNQLCIVQHIKAANMEGWMIEPLKNGVVVVDCNGLT